MAIFAQYENWAQFPQFITISLEPLKLISREDVW
jgi:hypothetical protein